MSFRLIYEKHCPRDHSEDSRSDYGGIPLSIGHVGDAVRGIVHAMAGEKVSPVGQLERDWKIRYSKQVVESAKGRSATLGFYPGSIYFILAHTFAYAKRLMPFHFP